jgi:NADH:ubiquinone oxidoreductase subunit 5 (subunit L)/multisubunit Na+/H+ antiporter MnhA subunit
VYPLWLGYIAASLTCYYSLRSLYLSYNTRNSFSSLNSILYHQNSLFLLFPLLVLSLGSIIAGYMLNFTILEDVSPIMVSNFTKFFPLLIGIMVSAITFLVFLRRTFINKVLRKFLIGTWYFNEVINILLLKYSKHSFSYSYKLLDNQILEFTSPTGLSRMTKIITSWSNTSSLCLRSCVSQYPAVHSFKKDSKKMQQL